MSSLNTPPWKRQKNLMARTVLPKEPNWVRLTADNITVVAAWCKGRIVEEIDPFTNERLPALNVVCQNDEVKRARLGRVVQKLEDGSFNVTHLHPEEE